MTTLQRDHGSVGTPTDDADGQSPRRQVKVTITGRLIDVIYRLRDYYDLPSVAATVSRAVALLDQMSELEDEGGSVIYRRADGTEQVLKIIMV